MGGVYKRKKKQKRCSGISAQVDGKYNLTLLGLKKWHL